MSWLTSSPSALAIVAAKAALMYVTALFGLRLGERRTLAQWTIIDFAAAVAMGAIVGRTAVASTQSYATGAVALLTIVGVHRIDSRLRFRTLLSKLADHRVRVLVARHGPSRPTAPAGPTPTACRRSPTCSAASVAVPAKVCRYAYAHWPEAASVALQWDGLRPERKRRPLAPPTRRSAGARLTR